MRHTLLTVLMLAPLAALHATETNTAKPNILFILSDDHALRAKQEGRVGIIVPRENAAEAAVVDGLDVIPVQNLREAVSFLEGSIEIAPQRVDLTRLFDYAGDDMVDMADVKGQESVKRALEIAAASGHNLLMLSLNRLSPAKAWLVARQSDLAGRNGILKSDSRAGWRTSLYAGSLQR